MNEQNYISNMRSALTEYMEQAGESQNQTAKVLGVSKTVLSQYLNSSYPGDNYTLARKVEQFIQMGTARRAVATAPDICLEVQNTKKILGYASVAHLYGDIALLYGPAGCGKSTALRHYAQENHGVIYVEADVTTNSPRCILKLILVAISEEPKGSTADMMQKIVRKLADTKRLLIIDEAQHLTEKAFDAVRAINDKTQVGIVYAGNPGILRRMEGDGRDTRNSEKLDQVFSRTVYKYRLSNTYSRQDITGIYGQYGLDKDCLQYLHQVSRRKGGLRLMVNQCRVAQNIAASLNEGFSVAHLEKAAVRMGIGGAA